MGHNIKHSKVEWNKEPNILSFCLLINLHFAWHLTNLFLEKKKAELQLLKILARSEIIGEIRLQAHRALVRFLL